MNPQVGTERAYPSIMLTGSKVCSSATRIGHNISDFWKLCRRGRPVKISLRRLWFVILHYDTHNHLPFGLSGSTYWITEVFSLKTYVLPMALFLVETAASRECRLTVFLGRYDTNGDANVSNIAETVVSLFIPVTLSFIVVRVRDIAVVEGHMDGLAACCGICYAQYSPLFE
eukprot:scaffold7858_cov132-Amphora_coffeaeformis.AAC.1